MECGWEGIFVNCNWLKETRTYNYLKDKNNIYQFHKLEQICKDEPPRKYCMNKP